MKRRLIRFMKAVNIICCVVLGVVCILAYLHDAFRFSLFDGKLWQLCLIGAIAILIYLFNVRFTKKVGYLDKLNLANKDSKVALIGTVKGDNCGALLRIDKDIWSVRFFEHAFAYHDEKVYFVSLADTKSSLGGQIPLVVRAYSLDGELVSEIPLGLFSANINVRVDFLTNYTHFNNEDYRSEFGNDAKDKIYYIYDRGALYLKDSLRCVKYCIAESTVSEIEGCDVFQIDYTYKVSGDGKSAVVKNLNDKTEKILTIKQIDASCKEIKELIDVCGEKNTFLGGYRCAEMPRAYPKYSRLINNIDGVLYVTVTIKNPSGTLTPIVLLYDYQNETFEFCVAGDEDSMGVVIPIL